MNPRTQKQLIIGLIFIVFIGGISYGFVDHFLITETTCFDKIRNGQEEGVDCGLLACGISCEPAIMPLDVLFQKLIEVKPGDYDFVAQINNPNSLFGASLVRYDLNLVGSKGGGTLLDKSGTFYVLPGQTRFVIVPGIRIADGAVDISIDITQVAWEKVESFENISFPVQRKNYTVIARNGVFSELEAVVLNNSDFDFDKIDIGVVLFDENNEIIAVNQTDIRTFISRTERYFKVNWPSELPTAVARWNIEVLTNVLENSNFIKRYGTQERFQKYY